MNTASNNNDDNDAGAPLPDFRASGIQLQTVAPALGVTGAGSTPEYLDYDTKGRGIIVTMFANAGMAYMLGVGAGGAYGFREALASTPSARFRVKLNAILNQCGRHGSRYGNALGSFAVLYSLYEGLADNVRPLFCFFVYAFRPRGRHSSTLGAHLSFHCPVSMIHRWILRKSWACEQSLRLQDRWFHQPLALGQRASPTLLLPVLAWQPWQGRWDSVPSVLLTQSTQQPAFLMEEADFCSFNNASLGTERLHVHFEPYPTYRSVSSNNFYGTLCYLHKLVIRTNTYQLSQPQT